MHNSTIVVSNLIKDTEENKIKWKFDIDKIYDVDVDIYKCVYEHGKKRIIFYLYNDDNDLGNVEYPFIEISVSNKDNSGYSFKKRLYCDNVEQLLGCIRYKKGVYKI